MKRTILSNLFSIPERIVFVSLRQLLVEEVEQQQAVDSCCSSLGIIL
jgi:hypothetical protein